MQINWLKKIFNKGPHNAFTDLCRYKQSMYCCFRQALDHVSGDGFIRILQLDFDGNTSSTSFIKIANMDLRDPKLSVCPDGRLMLIAYARPLHSHNKSHCSKNLCWVSQDGLSWSSPTSFAEHNWWLWRIRWQNNQAFGFAYNRQKNAIDLYQGDPRRTFQKTVPDALSLEKHHLAYPNESDLAFYQNRCVAIVRRDAGSYSAQLGLSQFPFKTWHWKDLGFYLGGPVMHLLDDNRVLLAGRVIQGRQLKTALFTLCISSGNVEQKLLLPSAGDNSYPGLVIIEEQIYMSYYSSHEDQKSSIYLANISL